MDGSSRTVMISLIAKDAPGGIKVVWVERLDTNAVPMSSPAVDAARVRLAADLGVEVGEIGVDSVDEVQWSNTSLGCPDPDRMYEDVIVPGFRVRLEHQGRQYEYHTDDNGSQVVTC